VDAEALRALPDLAKAVAFATQNRKRPKLDGAAPLEKRARALRKLLFKSASALVEAGVFPQGELGRLSPDKGAEAVANDCVRLAALFHANAAVLQGKTVITAEQTREAVEIGAELKRRHDAEQRASSTDAKKLRDRLWTLFVERHERLWRVGAYLFG